MKKITLFSPLIALIPTVAAGLTTISCSKTVEKYSEKDIDTTKSFNLRFNELEGQNLSFGEAKDLYYDLVIQHPEVFVDTIRHQRYCFWKNQDLTDVKETLSIENMTIEKVVDIYDTYLELSFDFEITSKASDVECKIPEYEEIVATKWDFYSRMHIEKAWFRLVPDKGTYTLIFNFNSKRESRSSGLTIDAQTRGFVNLTNEDVEKEYTFADEQIQITEYTLESSLYELVPLMMLFLGVDHTPYFDKVECIKFISLNDESEKNVSISAADQPIDWSCLIDKIIYGPCYGVYPISVQSDSLYFDCGEVYDGEQYISTTIQAKDETIDVGDTITFDLSISIFDSDNFSCASVNILKGFKVTFVNA